LDWIAFPVRIERHGWLARSHSPAESIVQMLKIMVSTTQGGWRGAAEFGMRDILAGLGSRHGARLAAIKHMNQTLADLGIDWVRVEAIEREPATTSYSAAYLFTLSFAGKGTEAHRIEM
jgi:hypothetical protein